MLFSPLTSANIFNTQPFGLQKQTFWENYLFKRNKYVWNSLSNGELHLIPHYPHEEFCKILQKFVKKIIKHIFAFKTS